MTNETKSLPIPLHDVSAPVVCTARAGDIADHIARLERLREAASSIERTADGVLIHFPREADVAADARTFAADEKQCCQFWGFEVAGPDGE